MGNNIAKQFRQIGWAFDVITLREKGELKVYICFMRLIARKYPTHIILESTELFLHEN